jgi:hypothetical protein
MTCEGTRLGQSILDPGTEELTLALLSGLLFDGSRSISPYGVVERNIHFLGVLDIYLPFLGVLEITNRSAPYGIPYG